MTAAMTQVPHGYVHGYSGDDALRGEHPDLGVSTISVRKTVVLLRIFG